GAQVPHLETKSAIDELSSRRNVHFLGAKSVQDLAAYPQHFDVCIMPYEANDYTKYIYPLKLHEYLASGRPTVGTRIRSLEEFADVVALASMPDEWSAAIIESLDSSANTGERRAARQAVARRHDWHLLVAQIAKTMARRLGHDFADRFMELHDRRVEP
ncbi:MAG: glycosyltransferase, partial [Woeseia sp.]